MYFYVFDSYLQDRKYQADIARIETRLGTLGIAGRTEKLTILKNIVEATKEAIKRGAKTVVVVGNDATVAKILPLLIERNIMLGLIPLGPGQLIAKLLGIPEGVAACDVLSRRIMRQLDVGKANLHYFLLNAHIPAGASVRCDNRFTVSSLNPDGSFDIMNLGTHQRVAQPDDGRLELVIDAPPGGGWFRNKRTSRSVFPVRTAKVQATDEPLTIVLDNHLSVRTPVTVAIAEQPLAVIVGRDRLVSS